MRCGVLALVLLTGWLTAAEQKAVITGYGVVTYDDAQWVFEKTNENGVWISTLTNVAKTKAFACFSCDLTPGFDKVFSDVPRLLKKTGRVEILGKDVKDKDKGYTLSARILADDNKTVWNTVLVMQRRPRRETAIIAYHTTAGDPREDAELKEFWRQLIFFSYGTNEIPAK